MPPSFPPAPLATTDWPQPRAARLVRAGGAAFILLVALALLAAWSVPPLLDWGRFRGSIAAIAAAQLGRPVVIQGEVTLRLLPEAVLTAADVSLPPVREGATHKTDGISAQLGTLRLQVAIWPLLTGRVVVRDLTLGAPVLSLPWPLPASIAHPARPRLPHEFAAHMENGTLRIGGISMTGITAVLHGDPAPRSAAGGDGTPPGTFEAEGFARFAGHDWRFASALGAPDADGVSAIDLSMRMLLPAGSPAPGGADATGATIRATLADGVIQGRLHAGGPDLAELLSRHAEPAAGAAALDWQAEAPFVATGAGIETGGLSLSVGDTVMSGGAVLHFGDAAMLEASLSSPALDLDQWAPLWAEGAVATGPDSAIATGFGLHLVLAANSATLFGGALHDLQATLRSDGTHLMLDQGGAILPGDARLALGPASLRERAGQLDFAGPVSLVTTDARAALAWLWPGSAAWLAALPPALPAAVTMTLHGGMNLAPGQLTLDGVCGVIEGTRLSGALRLRQGPRPRVDLAMTLDHLALDHLAALDWPAGTRARVMGTLRADGVLPALAALDRHVSAIDGTLDLRLARPTWHGHRLDDVRLGLRTGDSGLSLDHLALGVDGVGLEARGAVTRDGVLQPSRLALHVAHLANIASLLPADWHWPANFAGLALLQNAGLLEVAGQGSQSALAWQMRADAGDLVVETDATTDMIKAQTSATVTLRHPGAPRLLASLGVAGTDGWIGTGSVALVAHVKVTHGDIAVPDFTMNAADMRLAGSLDVAGDGTQPRVSGDLRADLLALPAISPDIARLPPWLARQRWLADMDSSLTLHAASVTFDQRPALADLAMNLRGGQGVILASPLAARLVARLAGGANFSGALVSWALVRGALAIDTTRSPPVIAAQATLRDVSLASPVASLPIDPTGGMLDLSTDLQATGNSRAAILASLDGTVSAVMRDATLKGFDLQQLGKGRRRAARLKALATGASAGLDGRVEATLRQGRLTLQSGLLQSADGQVSVSGSADLPDGDLNLEFGLMPSVPHAEDFTLRLKGTVTKPKLTSSRSSHLLRKQQSPQPRTRR